MGESNSDMFLFFIIHAKKCYMSKELQFYLFCVFNELINVDVF